METVKSKESKQTTVQFYNKRESARTELTGVYQRLKMSDSPKRLSIEFNQAGWVVSNNLSKSRPTQIEFNQSTIKIDNVPYVIESRTQHDPTQGFYKIEVLESGKVSIAHSKHFLPSRFNGKLTHITVG